MEQESAHDEENSGATMCTRCMEELEGVYVLASYTDSDDYEYAFHRECVTLDDFEYDEADVETIIGGMKLVPVQTGGVVLANTDGDIICAGPTKEKVLDAVYEVAQEQI